MKVLGSKEVCYKKYTYESHFDEKIMMFDTLAEMSEWLHEPGIHLEAYREYYSLFTYLQVMDETNSKFNMEFELNFGNTVKIVRIEKK